ncbi:MAG: hypothetical protein A2Z74_05870 [Chloroflexi bacterium RBG_13_46_9]|nr:MAG: hypothetical protein A2Z74_05870 [Chloroflexi bacterium RBG_13_46_9]
MEEQYFDNTGIVARSKREQLMREAEEYRLRRHITAMKKNEKVGKEVTPEKRRGYELQPRAAHNPAPAN